MKKRIILTILISSVINAFEYPKPIEGYFSQKGQDKFLNEEIFKNKKNGFFVEIGAHDGISFSNTYFFEKYLGWSGICVDPNPDIFKKLVKNRKCYCEQICISNSIDPKKFLKCTGYILEMYSGLLENMDSRHTRRINNEIQEYGGDKEVILVECTTLKMLFEKYKVSHIDLLSIDIEGGEREAIQTIEFDKIKIDTIVIENNFNEDDIKNMLISKGYKFLIRLGKDDIFQLKDNS